MDRPTRHIVFNPSARSSLLQALKTLGRPDEVVALFDDLRLGPLDLSDLEARETWFEDELRVCPEPGFIAYWHDEFWTKALDPNCRLVVWTTRRSAGDRTGYLAWASRLGPSPAEVIDISDIVFEWTDWKGRPHSGLLPVPHVTPVSMIERGLFDLARPVGESDRTEANAEFARLRQEAGAFRAVIDGALTTLPLDAFDERLIAATSRDYRKAARVVGEVLVEMDGSNGWSVGDLALAARLMVLVETGRLEAQGDPYGSIRYYEVRRPGADLR